MKSYRQFADQLVNRLNKEGLDAYIWCHATTGSAYIRFKDSRMCSIRVGDHDGREKYKYKYNVRSDVKEFHKHKDEMTWRYYFPMNAIDKLIEELKLRKEIISTWTEHKYEYGIPSFKK